MYCDDLATVGKSGTERILLVTECKGTIATVPMSREKEAKAFYQLSRTFVKLKRTMTSLVGLRLYGVISVVVNHTRSEVTINVIDGRSLFVQVLPDEWMYPDQNPDTL